MAHPCAPFDRGGMEAINVQFLAHLFEHAQFDIGQLAIGGRDITGKCISGLVETLGQRISDQTEKRIKPVFLLKQIKNRLRHGANAVGS